MELIKTNGDILKLSVLEYKELFLEKVKPKTEVKEVVIKRKRGRPKNSARISAQIQINKIIEFVKDQEEKVSFPDLVKKFKIPSGGSSSKIMALLRANDGVNTERIGKAIYISIAKPKNRPTPWDDE